MGQEIGHVEHRIRRGEVIQIHQAQASVVAQDMIQPEILMSWPKRRGISLRDS